MQVPPSPRPEPQRPPPLCSKQPSCSRPGGRWEDFSPEKLTSPREKASAATEMRGLSTTQADLQSPGHSVEKPGRPGPTPCPHAQGGPTQPSMGSPESPEWGKINSKQTNSNSALCSGLREHAQKTLFKTTTIAAAVRTSRIILNCLEFCTEF